MAATTDNKSAEALKAADALLITAGAGMGVDSGLPDFRGGQGFWRAYPAIARPHVPLSRLRLYREAGRPQVCCRSQW